MKKFAVLILSVFLLHVTKAQTTQGPPAQSDIPDVVRITTNLVQTDIVVTDKNDRIISNLRPEEIKIYENGKRQELKFVQFVSGDNGFQMENKLAVDGQPVDPDVARNLSARDLHRVFAFVVDDLTVPLEDVANVRNLLNDFINNKMHDGDLVSITRVSGGRGLLQQFTGDRQILRRAISEIRPVLNAYSAFNNTPAIQGVNKQPQRGQVSDNEIASPAIEDLETSESGVISAQRSLITLGATGEVINSMTSLPGRKSLVLISGGLPLYEVQNNQISINGAPTTVAEANWYLTNVSYLLRQLTDRATRAGVVINTMDVRGLSSSRGVSLFTDPGNEARSALFGGGGSDPNFGRAPNMAQFDNKALDTLSGHLGLQALSSSTGGLSVLNTNNFDEGLNRIADRSSYYLLAYRPSESFDGKFHKLEIRIDRPGAKVYTRSGYFARADELGSEPKTKEDAILRAVKSSLAKREIDVTGMLQYRFLQTGGDIDINILIDAHNITFKQEPDGRYHASFDVVGFLVNALGKSANGFSQTIGVAYSPEQYELARRFGISYTAHAAVPSGVYQLRAVVRDADSGRLGSMSQFVEVPDLAKKRLTVSSLFLYAVDPEKGKQAKPEPLIGLRQLSRKMDLRYAAIVYNPKATSGKTQLQSHIIISRNGIVLFQESDQPVTGAVENGQLPKLGQFSLAKVSPGRLLLTLVVTDPQAGKEARTIVRSIDFTLVD